MFERPQVLGHSFPGPTYWLLQGGVLFFYVAVQWVLIIGVGGVEQNSIGHLVVGGTPTVGLIATGLMIHKRFWDA